MRHKPLETPGQCPAFGDAALSDFRLESVWHPYLRTDMGRGVDHGMRIGVAGKVRCSAAYGYSAGAALPRPRACSG